MKPVRLIAAVALAILSIKAQAISTSVDAMYHSYLALPVITSPEPDLWAKAGLLVSLMLVVVHRRLSSKF